jgi:tRNA threonylcarbamoyladenosine biosynthesis protein TsaB
VTHGDLWLAIDTATDTAGIALDDGVLLAEELWTTRRRHTEQLAPKVDALFVAHGREMSDLAAIAVAIGPGSYTGLRIGLALAKGLALGTGAIVVGVPTLDVLAAPLSPPHAARDAVLWAVLRAGRGRIVAGRYPPASEDWPDPATLRVQTGAELVAAVRPGDWIAGEIEPDLRSALVEAGARVLAPAACARRAGWLVERGRARRVRHGAPLLGDLTPVYLR